MRGMRAVMIESDRHAFLMAAVNDAEGTIRATDTKASIALVLHGLLLAALVNVTTEIGNIYAAAGCQTQLLLVVLLVLIAAALLVSVAQLLRCVTPAPVPAIPDVAAVPVSHFFLSIPM